MLIKYQIFKRVDEKGKVSYDIIQQPDQCKIRLKRVTAFAFDAKTQNLMLILEKKIE